MLWSWKNTVIGVSPFGLPDAELVRAVSSAGGLGVLDLGAGDRAARTALGRVAGCGSHGVRIALGCALRPADLIGADAGGPDTLVLVGQVPGWPVADLREQYHVLVEVTDLTEGLAAVALGAHGLIARGAESGGRVGELSAFVLLQQLLAAPGITVPVWACGGIGRRTAAAAVAAGAAGVVLDSQLALLAESGVPGGLAARIRRMDGSETEVVAGRRVLKSRSGARSEAGEVPVGEDGALAAIFADRWSTAARVVNALTTSIREVLDAAALPGATTDWIGPGAALCGTLRTALPLAQGPMTRVSDQPAFAASVAAAGALPFLALALAGAQQTRTLLEQTAAALGESPWGVGVLGFAPEDVRTAQLAEVLAARPTHAIIAGGRPSQARVLEDAGITTFLHVPSPGLLQQFLADGARRFVFEGAECGGHIGPRHSFALWETQLAVLEDFLTRSRKPERVEVLFAGGIHDERSAAIVAALAAPLAPRSEAGGGLLAGCLMGTAYLFTDEAVACGAVQPQFQDQVRRARGTALLQTAPGHVTRCVPSAFTEEFEQLREQLRAEGVAEREIWERLERLNVGRLRIASKGLERVADDLVEVGEAEQITRGMFMAGQVAILRDSVTNVADLHASVTTGAAQLLADRALTMRQTADTMENSAVAPLDIAVVGMACVFPQAPDLAAFWANIVAGTDAVTEVPRERWDPDLYWSATGGPGTTPSKWGGFIDPVPFDALSYGIPPAALGSIEPVQLLSLEVARRALVDAGYDALGQGDGRAFDRSRTSVIFGAEAGSDLSGAGVLGSVLPSYLGSVPEGIAAQLPAVTEDTFPGVLSNVISGRIANRLDLGGSNFTVDAACASSLAALDVACKELIAGTADMALCGGADMHNGINDYLLFASVHALSPTGRSRPFDSTADGIALGEGVACLVLKRLADAERDGDRVYAVVSGIGSASDGRSLGLTAPRPEGQRAALERAYHSAGVSPAAVGLLEAHGTGTVVGDRTELTTLTEVFAEAGAEPGSCVLGSVKSQIGHTKCAAGLAGLIKAALALHTGVRPGTLHLKQPNPAWRAGTGPFAFHTQAQPWPKPASDRVAGVSSFGFGGTNFHAVLRAHDAPAPTHGMDRWPAELFLFRGADRTRAVAAVNDLLRLVLTPHSPWRLRDLALTAANRAAAGTGPVQIAIVAADVTELTTLLQRAAAGEQAPAAGLHVAAESTEAGSVAFLFPGQGSQRVGMFAELFAAFPALQRHLRHGSDYAEALYPPAAFTPEAVAENRARVVDTRIAQPTLGMTGLAAVDLLAMAGIRPDTLGGHSYGELVALCAAGALSEADLPLLSHERGRVILEAVGEGNDPGAMAAVLAGAAEVQAVLEADGSTPHVVIANHNSPRQTVISGCAAQVEAVLDRLREAGLSAKRIPVACAFHSPVVAGAAALLGEVLAERDVQAPELPVYANRTAAPYPADADGVRAELAAQVVSPVRFTDQVEAMYAAGARVFLEAGPGSVLTNCVTAVLGDRPHRAIALEGRRTGLPGFLDALAELAVAGVDVDLVRLLRGREALDAARSTAPRRAGWTVDGQLVRTADGDLLAGALAPARIVEAPIMVAQSNGPALATGAEALIADFVRSGREMIAAQRDVLLALMGTDPGSMLVRVPAPVSTQQLVTTAAPAAGPVVASTVVASVVVPAAAVPVLTADSVLAAVVEVVAERTGYPAEMIEPDLDLESDLSVDSIKRTEIVGLLAQRLTTGTGEMGLETLSDAELEELSRARTAAAVTEWIMARLATAIVTAPPAAIAAPTAARPVLTAAAVLAAVVEVVAERTGYPAEMIEPDLDLESDLSVDSIKRTEIVGLLARRLTGGDDEVGLDALSDAELEELSRARTATAVTEWIMARLAGPAADVASSARPTTGEPPAAPEPVVGYPPVRLVTVRKPVSEPARDPKTLAGKRFLALGGDTDLPQLADLLAAHGAELLVREATHEASVADGRIDGVLLLDPLCSDGPTVLPTCVPALQAALSGGPDLLLAVRRAADVGNGDLGRSDGLRGLMRSLAREYPDAVVRLVELEAAESGESDAQAVFDELLAGDREPVVLRGADGRFAPALEETGLGLLAASGAGPAGEGAAEAQALGLDRDAVVLLVGGARGITAQFAATLAAAAGCRLELLGRTTLPDGPEDPVTAGAADRMALRAVLARQGVPMPQIDATASALLAAREVTATLTELRGLGSQVQYRSVDAADPEALAQAAKEVHAAYGRLDGVVFAAGVIEDRLFAEKDPRSFARVWATKAEGARALLDALADLPDGPRFTVLFGSIAAALGNRGQTDYAAANDALESLCERWSQRTGRRSLTVHWGPWAPGSSRGGMVSPELARDYARRGIRLIDPDAGTLALLRELAWGPESLRAVVHTASGW